MDDQDFRKAHANLTSHMVNDLLKEGIKRLLSDLEAEWDCVFSHASFELTTTQIEGTTEEYVDISVATRVWSKPPSED